MTDTERKALALVNEVRTERGWQPHRTLSQYDCSRTLTLCRAIEQHEAFRQEVSDAVEGVVNSTYMPAPSEHKLRRFIIAKPDPLDEAVKEAASKWMNAQEPLTDGVRAAIEKRGGKIVWGEG